MQRSPIFPKVPNKPIVGPTTFEYFISKRFNLGLSSTTFKVLKDIKDYF